MSSLRNLSMWRRAPKLKGRLIGPWVSLCTSSRSAVARSSCNGCQSILAIGPGNRRLALQESIRRFHKTTLDRRQLVAHPDQNSSQNATPATLYRPPTSGILSRLPASWVPYAELMRIDKPTGTYYLFFPCLFSTLMAAPMLSPIAPISSVAGFSLLFLSGAFIMRGAGCTINDLWDRDLDPHVRRTRLRPVARGAVKPFNAIAFLGCQLLAGLAILLQFPLPCVLYGMLSLPLVVTYPLAKRVTYYPQVVLGLTFSWGAILGFPALGLDLISNSSALTAAACLYASNVAWTVFYDMIYAHMDIKDDAKAGIKSIALKHDANTRMVLATMAVTQVAFLAAAGMASGAGPVFFAGSCGGAAITLAIMILRVNLKNARDCWWWFVKGCWITGGTISAGMAGDYLVRRSAEEERQREAAPRINGYDQEVASPK